VTRVLVAANSAVVRAGLESLVAASPELELAGSVLLTDVASRMAGSLPDVVLAGLASGQAGIPEDLAALAAGGTPAVVLVAEDPRPALIAAALEAGIRGVLPHDIAPPELAAATAAASAGLVVLHPHDLLSVMAAPRRERTSDDRPSSAALSPREVEVLRMLAEGMGNKEIAWQLGISEHTVKFHVASILNKLGATTRTEAVTLGIRRGLILL
jgi:DNA-binding NarL/FixJ family response regulator